MNNHNNIKSSFSGGTLNMKKNILSKTMVAGLTVLLIGAIALPSISADIQQNQTTFLAKEMYQPQQTTAGGVIWEDNFDSYDLGQFLDGTPDDGGWECWDEDVNVGSYVVDTQARSGPHSLDIVAASDTIHQFTGLNYGQFTLTAWQYVPGDLVGISYFLVLSLYEHGLGQENEWQVQVYFDADQQMVYTDDGDSLPLITDEWVEIRVEIDLDTDWHEFFYDDDLLYEKNWTAGPFNANEGYLNIDCLDLYASFATSVFYDDISIVAHDAFLGCEGELAWTDVSPGSTQTGSFTVENIGGAGTLLNWEIVDPPDWGTWTFTPDSGTGLTPEDGAITIDVEVTAPDEKDKEFSGEIVIANSDHPNSTCTIKVSLATPVSKPTTVYSMFQLFLQRLFERFPLLEKLLL